jgi:glycosyltransferase involved in cell wall biosynthesis
MKRRNKKLKVFQGLINYGSQAWLFAKNLREHNITALSVSFPDYLKRHCDIELLYGGNFFQKLIRHLWNWIRRFYWFFKFNTFHFYYGSSLFPRQWDLPCYRLLGKKVIMHYLGNDVQGFKQTVEKYKWTNMHGFMGDDDPVEYDRRIASRLAYESRYADLQIVGGPYLSEFVENSIVIPLAIDIDEYNYAEPPYNETLVALHAPTHRGFKGTEYILAAVERLISEGYPLKLNLVENSLHSRMKDEHIKADFFIDQLMAGWYGAASLEAMALGRPVICSLRKSYFEHIDYGNKIPVIHADPDCVYESIKYLIENREKLPEIGRACRKFVEEVHDVRRLTDTMLEYYKKIWA